jgi:hypothetical protein
VGYTLRLNASSEAFRRVVQFLGLKVMERRELATPIRTNGGRYPLCM